MIMMDDDDDDDDDDFVSVTAVLGSSLDLLECTVVAY